MQFMTRRVISGRYADSATRLRAVRKYFGMNQKDFAANADIQYKSYNQWESGDFRVSIPGAIKLRERYGISMDFIYIGNIDALPTKMANELMSILRDNASNKSNDNGDV
ncbi:helix-turn-helix transcriptional regulator [Pseudovibrio denitrificans]|uniref:helix-turn-helix transcriptional regulator n=2 Tax=Pseudovibrio TaxID=258255 RepID=UPI000D693732